MTHKKQRGIHYTKRDTLGVSSPACGTRSQDAQLTTDRRRVTCENCIKTKLYKGRRAV